jgi:hypothetical protein
MKELLFTRTGRGYLIRNPSINPRTSGLYHNRTQKTSPGIYPRR